MTSAPLVSTWSAATAYRLLPPLSHGEFEALKEDIARRGMKVPVEVDEHGEILDGHHRVAIAKSLGMTSYPRTIRARLTEEEKIEHILQLNLARRHLTVDQRRSVVAGLQSQHWSARRIAAALRVSHPTVLRDQNALAAAADAGGTSEPPALKAIGRDGKSYPARRKPTEVTVATAHQERQAIDALHALGEAAPTGVVPLKTLTRAQRTHAAQQRRQEAQSARVPLPAEFDLRHCRMQDLDLAVGSVDLVLTDPPYTRKDLDSGVWRDLGTFAMDALKPGGLLVALSPTMWLPQAMGDLTAAGLEYAWMLTITFPQSPRQVRQRGLASGYRPVLVFRRAGGDSDTLPGWLIDNITGGGRAKDHGHPWEQSTQEMLTILKAWTQAGDLVVDPFLGTGTTAVAALEAGCRFIGCDVEEQWVDTAQARLAAGEPATVNGQ